jgi:hypothetical protein
LQYAIQCRRDEQTVTAPFRVVNMAIGWARRAGAGSMLDLSEPQWRQLARSARRVTAADSGMRAVATSRRRSSDGSEARRRYCRPGQPRHAEQKLPRTPHRLMEDHARGPVGYAVRDTSPQVTAMIDKMAQDNMRYRILHAAARLTRGGRQRRLNIQATWPWAADIITAWGRISALPQAP